MKKLKKILTKNNIFSTLIILVTLTLLAFSAYFKMIPIAMTLDDNGVAQIDIYVPFDYYDEEGTIIMAEAAAKNTLPVLVKLNDATFSAFEDVTLFFDDTDGYRNDLAMNLSQSLDYSSYLDNKINLYISYCLKRNITIDYEIGKQLLSEISDAEYANLKSMVKTNFSIVQNRDVFTENREELLAIYRDNTRYSIINRELNEFSNKIAIAFLRINSIINVEKTAIARDSAKNDVLDNHAIIIYEGTLLLEKGKTADENTMRLLDVMELSGNKNFNEKIFIGVIGLLLILLIPVWVFKQLFSRNKKYTKRHIIVICLLLLFLFALVFLVPIEYKMFIPVFFLPMLIAILVDEKMAVIVGAVSIVFLGFIYKGDAIYLGVLITGGTLSAFFAKKVHIRMKLLSSGLIIGGVAATTLFVGTLAVNGSIGDVIYDMLALTTSGMIAVILVLGLLPLFETIFNIVTPFKLMELSNPNKPLLKKLLIEAPGTYHHSLMVGNLAEEAANEIGANGLLARVGAYYHDIGKMSRPAFYKENQGNKENPHDKMKPELSKLVITSHTKEGDEIAKKYKLPHAIRDIIVEHHGTTQVKYFYNKALEQNGKGVNADAFRYSGPRPKSKESAVVMLADSIEATIRAHGDISRGEVEGIIRRSIKDKLDDRQFALCDLTLKDFDDISNAFMRVFSGYFHKRVEYPEPKEGGLNGIED